MGAPYRQVQLDIGFEEKDNGTAIVRLSGRLMQGPEGEGLESLVRALLEKGTRKVLLDYRALTHIDSTGIGRTIAALNQVMERGGEMAVACGPGPVRQAFRITLLDKVFRFYDDLESAEAALAA